MLKVTTHEVRYMSDIPEEFLTDEFFLKLIRLGVEDPELRHPSRLILQKLHKKREEEGGITPKKDE